MNMRTPRRAARAGSPEAWSRRRSTEVRRRFLNASGQNTKFVRRGPVVKPASKRCRTRRRPKTVPEDRLRGSKASGLQSARASAARCRHFGGGGETTSRARMADSTVLVKLRKAEGSRCCRGPLLGTVIGRPWTKRHRMAMVKTARSTRRLPEQRRPADEEGTNSGPSYSCGDATGHAPSAAACSLRRWPRRRRRSRGGERARDHRDPHAAEEAKACRHAMDGARVRVTLPSCETFETDSVAYRTYMYFPHPKPASLWSVLFAPTTRSHRSLGGAFSFRHTIGSVVGAASRADVALVSTSAPHVGMPLQIQVGRRSSIRSKISVTGCARATWPRGLATDGGSYSAVARRPAARPQAQSTEPCTIALSTPLVCGRATSMPDLADAGNASSAKT